MHSNPNIHELLCGSNIPQYLSRWVSCLCVMSTWWGQLTGRVHIKVFTMLNSLSVGSKEQEVQGLIYFWVHYQEPVLKSSLLQKS